MEFASSLGRHSTSSVVNPSSAVCQVRVYLFKSLRHQMHNVHVAVSFLVQLCKMVP